MIASLCHLLVAAAPARAEHTVPPATATRVVDRYHRMAEIPGLVPCGPLLQNDLPSGPAYATTLLADDWPEKTDGYRRDAAFVVEPDGHPLHTFYTVCEGGLGGWLSVQGPYELWGETVEFDAAQAGKNVTIAAGSTVSVRRPVSCITPVRSPELGAPQARESDGWDEQNQRETGMVHHSWLAVGVGAPSGTRFHVELGCGSAAPTAAVTLTVR